MQRSRDSKVFSNFTLPLLHVHFEQIPGWFRLRLLQPTPQRTSTPIFRTLDQLGPQRIAFHVTTDGKEVVIILNGKALESALVHMPFAGTIIVGVIPHRMRRRLEAVAARWSIEEHFHDVKEVWGAGQQQVRNVWSNIGCWNLNGCVPAVRLPERHGVAC